MKLGKNVVYSRHKLFPRREEGKKTRDEGMRVRGRVVHGLFTQGQVDKGGKDIAWTAIPLTRYVVMYCNNTGAVNLEPIIFLYLVVLMFRFVLYGHPLAPSPPSTLTECHLQDEAR